MKKLVFPLALAVLLLVESTVAYATPGDNFADRDNEKWFGGERANWGIPRQPQVAARQVCHKIKERVGTRNGKAVYRTHQVCA